MDPPTTEPSQEPLSGKQIRSRALTGMISLTLRSVTIRAVNLAGLVILTRFLTPSDFGLLAFGFSVTAIGMFLAAGGLGIGLIRQESTPSRRQLESVLGVQLVGTVAAVLLVAAVGIPLGRAGAVTAFMVLALPIDTLRMPAALMTERALKYGPIVRAEVSEMLAYNVVALVLVVLGAGIWGVAVATVVRAAVGTIVLVVSTDTGMIRPHPRLAEVRPLYRFGLSLNGLGLLGLIRDQGTNFALVAIGGTATLGIASFVTRLVSPITLLFEASWRVSYPALSRLIDTGEDPGPTLTRALRLSSSVMGLGVAGLVASVPALVPSLFGARWNATIPAMPWALGALMVGGPMYVCVSGYLSAIGRADSLLKVSVIVSTVWLGVGIPLVPSFGAAGAATGWFVSSCLGLVLFGAKLSRLAHVPVERTVAPSLLAVVIAGAVGWLAADSFEPTLLIAVLGAGIGAVSYLAILGLLQPAAIREQRSLAQRLTRRGHAASEPA